MSMGSEDYKHIVDGLTQAQREMGYKEGGEKDLRADEALGGLVKLSPQMATTVNILSDVAVPYIRRAIEGGLRTHGARALGHVTPNNAVAIANVVADAAGWGTIFYKQLIGTVRRMSEYHRDGTKVAQELAIVLQANNLPVSARGLKRFPIADNEIVQVERGRVADNFSHGMKLLGASMIAAIPQAVDKWHDHHEKTKDVLQRRPDEDDHAFRRRQVTLLREKRSKDAQLERELRKENEEFMNTWVNDEYASRGKEVEEKIRDDLQRYWKQPDRSKIPVEEDHVKRKIREELEADLRRTQTSSSSERGKSDKPNNWIRDIMVPVGSIGAGMMAQNINAAQEKKQTKKTAFDMIKKISEEQDRNGKVERVDGRELTSYIMEVFNQHQENMGHFAIGKRHQKRFEEDCKLIAEAIQEGRMHPMALVELVGDRMIAKDKGKDIATVEETQAAIDKMAQKIPAKFTVSPSEYFSELSMKEEDMKDIVSSLKGADRDFFICLMPDEVAGKLGLKPEELKAARENGKGAFAGMLRQAILDVASLSDEQLQPPYDAPEVEKIREMGVKVKKEGLRSDVAAVGSFVAPRGEFKEGLAWLVINHKDYWKSIAKGERKIGDIYNSAGQKLYSELEDEKKAAEEAKRKAEEAEERKHAKADEDKDDSKSAKSSKRAAADDDEDLGDDALDDKADKKSFADKVGRKDSKLVDVANDNDDGLDVMDEEDAPGKQVNEAHSKGRDILSKSEHTRSA